MKIAFFDAKDYDIPSFTRCGKEAGIEFKFYETKLDEDTVKLSKGFDGVCVFVNDTVNAAVVDKQRRPKTVLRQNSRRARARLLAVRRRRTHHGNAPHLGAAHPQGV